MKRIITLLIIMSAITAAARISEKQIIETVRRLTARYKGVRILALSAHEDTAHPKRVLKAI